MIGRTLGSYQVVARLGVGGMGEVYRAHDTRLNRDVAIKVLPEAFADDAERLARFMREAQALAALNHPNIAAIYGIEEASPGESGREPVRALVMELVDGQDLSELIRLRREGRSSTPELLEWALPIARQVAEALEAAHDQGIIHRDLKPANIKVRPDGTVKVLDFGLAKALATEGTAGTADAMNSPTLTARATAMGMILGTAAYMAPEQARGRRVDRRADIWAFGCVLYEMLAGRRAFEGDDVTETLASVLRSDVAFDALPPDAPRPLVDLLRRCLERDARERLQAIGEARIALTHVTSVDQAPAAPTPAVRPSGVRMWTLVAIAAVAGAVLMAAALQSWRAEPAPAPTSKFLIATDAQPDRIKLSPDGRQVLFASGGRLFVRDLGQLEARELQGAGAIEGTGSEVAVPDWSPDGQSVVYGSGGKIWRIPASGGTPTAICNSPGVLSAATWKPNGMIVLAVTREALYEVSSNGGEPRVLLPLNGQDDVDFHNPFVLPDGESLLYSVHRVQGVDTIEVLSGGVRKVLLRMEGRARSGPQVLNTPRYSVTGHVVYRLDQGNAGVWAFPFSLDRLEATGEPFLVAAGGSQPTVAPDGTLAYAAPVAAGPGQLAWIRRDGSIEQTIGEPRSQLRLPRLSPDGRRIAFLADDPNTDVWVSNADGTGAMRVTSTPDNEGNPAWLPDQDALVFLCPGPDGAAICVKAADGTGEARVIVKLADDPVLSPDGSYLLYGSSGEARRGLLVRDLRSADAESREFVMSAEALYPVAILPGNRFALYWGFSRGQPVTFMKSFPSGEGTWEVTGLSAEGARLLPGGTSVGEIERQPDGTASLVAVPFETSPSVTFGPRQSLFTNLPDALQFDAGFDVSADGTRLLAVVSRQAGPVQHGIVVVTNWFSEFRTGG